ncbi:MAG: nickel pincer cofactor biosynthesis protein LarB [Methanoregula sp.]|nr:nickel pincer cofactor biosynthesis protein LarB [Methanoregula sp.]
MPPNQILSRVLARYKKGECSLEDAAREIEGLRMEHVGDFACLDLGRQVRCGMPEVVLAEGKDPVQLAEIAVRHAEIAGRCVVTRVNPLQVVQVQQLCDSSGIIIEHRELARVLILKKGDAPKQTGGIVAIITAGTSDIPVAEEAKIIAEEMGCAVLTAYDVGAAGIHRLFPALKPMLAAHVFVVCAGREGTLPAVVAGLVDKPVIGVPVSTGYGYMGGGRAALASMLQSCSVIAVVNIDAGFTAGAFAAQIANGSRLP